VQKLQIPDNLTSLAYKAIKTHIWEGHLDEGERLTEERLAQMLGISKSPIREALNRLETEGLIRIEPRRGAYLRVVSAKDIADLHDVREALEVHAIAIADVTPELLERLRESVERLRRYREANDRFRHLEETGIFHGILAGGTGNEKLVKILENLHQQVWMFRRKTYDVAESTALAYHRAIVAALETNDKAEAQRVMRAHISCVRQRLIGQIMTREAATEPIAAGRVALSPGL
jgi:DNA-binding GntR family transcriptional regulator